jgi:hypothetical protein
MSDLSNVAAIIINMIFVFATVSYVSTSATDALSSLLRWRAKFLLEHVKHLLDDPNFTGLARDLYANPLTNPLGNNQFEQFGEDDAKITPIKIDPKYFPADIDSRIFGLAMIEILNIEGIAQETIANATDANQIFPDFVKNVKESLLSNPKLSKDLKNLSIGMLMRNSRTKTSVEDLMVAMIQEIANWYDFSQVRTAGMYRKRIRNVTFVIAFILAAILNLQPIPFGRQPLSPGLRYGAVFFEWLIVAASTLFGGPFWFEILKKVSVGIVRVPTPQPTAGQAGQAVQRDADVRAAQAPPGTASSR